MEVDINNKTVLTVEEVSRYTGYEINYLYKMCSQRKIPHYNNKGGRRLFFKLSEIIEWLTDNKIQTVYELTTNNKNLKK